LTKTELLTLAAESKEMRNHCKNLCNGNDIYKDVFAEFLLYLCEQDGEVLIKKYNDIQFLGYCYFLLKRFNVERIRSAKRTNSKSRLMMGNCEYIEELQVFEKEITYDLNESEQGIQSAFLSNDKIIDEETEYDYEVDTKFDKVIDFMEQSGIKKYQAALLFSSIDQSTREISEKIGTPQRHVIYQINKIKNKIKENVK
jgi:hypothetical protein